MAGDDATASGSCTGRAVGARVGCDGLRGVRVGIMGAGSRRRSVRFGVLVSGRRVLDRPADPSRPVLVAVATLLGDDLVLDPVVGRLRHHLLLYKLVLGLIRPVLDNLLGVGLADALQ